MTNPNSFSSLDTLEQQPVSIKSVDPARYVANAVTRQGGMLQIDLNYHVGAVHVIPVEGDQWMVRRFGMTWALVSQLPHNTTELLTVADEPTQGLTQVGSSNPNGAGNLHLNGKVVVSNGALQLLNAPTGGMPDVGDREGVLAWDKTLKAPVFYNGSAWNLLAEPEGGFNNTDDLPEGSTNLYFTEARAADAAPVQSVNGLDGDVVITKAEVGLGNADNTSDANKPISTAMAAALDLKADLVSGVVPDSQLPPKGVREYDELADLPVVGDAEVLYITSDTGNLYRWNTTAASYDLIVSGSGTLSNSDELPEGTTNFYFTNARRNTERTATATLEAKTLNLADNTLTGTLAQFNTALSDANFATLTGTETFTGKTIDTASNTLIGLPYDLSYLATVVARETGLGDNVLGMKLQRAAVFTSVTYRCGTADASGNLVVELRKNGSTVSGTSTSIPAASQVAGATSTGTWSFAEGDILTVWVSAIGTTPGQGLVADIKGVTT